MTSFAEITALLPLPQSFGETSQAFAINQGGAVICYESDVETGTYESFVVANGVATLLSPTPNGAYALNDHGVVVGTAGNAYPATEWGVGFVPLVLNTVQHSVGWAINDLGTVGGSVPINGSAQGFIISNGATTMLTSFNPAIVGSEVSGLNNQNEAVGYITTTNTYGDYHAFLLQNGVLTNLDPADTSTALAINDSGLIVGYSNFYAASWLNGVMTILAELPGYQTGSANAVNNAGLIVGDAYDNTGSQHAVLWQNRAMIDLNGLLPANSGWVLQDAKGINDQGLIVGWGLYDGVQTAFEMSLNGITAPLHTAQAVAGLLNSGAAIPRQTVIDSAADVAAHLDALRSLAAAGDLAGITLTDGATPDLVITGAQFSTDAAALNDISTPHAVTVELSGSAAAHNFSGDNWTGANALQFADMTVIVAATPGGADSVTTGNVTELYSAVLAREPDVGGLAYYQNYLKANPATPLRTFAEFFLNSTEYSSAHSYAQTTAGETQFITDSYQNLLHRAPTASDITFYLTNVLEKPGTQLENHALMLVYFSASSEFLGDVQISAQNPASAQHWLILT